MKTILLLLLTIKIVASAHLNTKQHLLREIMNSVDSFPKEKVKNDWVAEAVTPKTCNHKNLCKAGKVLEEIKVHNLGLKEEWRLPRLLSSYSNENCTKPETRTTVPLPQLLKDIHYCAQKEHSSLAH